MTGDRSVRSPDPAAGGILFQGRVYWRDLRYSSNEGAWEIDWRLSDSFTNGVGSRVSAMPPAPSLPSSFGFSPRTTTLETLEAAGAVKAAAPAARATRTLANCILIVLRVCLRGGGAGRVRSASTRDVAI